MNKPASIHEKQRQLVLVVHQDFHDPAVNLALEEYIVRHVDVSSRAYVLLYVNRPALIVGKHQNVWEEADVAFCRTQGIPVIRRISGGGTVYHDEGNLNFSFITSHTLENFNQYRYFLQPIIEALKELNLAVELDTRNNLLISGKKISGNAQFTSRGKLLSHGTLLFDSDLSLLRRTLQAERNIVINSRATKSTLATVGNIREFLDTPYRLEDLKRLILKHLFKGEIREMHLKESEWQQVFALAQKKYGTWEWNFGQSPHSVISKTFLQGRREMELHLTIEKGHIVETDCPQDNSIAKRIFPYLRSQPFEYEALKSVVWEMGQNPGLSDLNFEPILNGL